MHMNERPASDPVHLMKTDIKSFMNSSIKLALQKHSTYDYASLTSKM